jgi:tetratricopeptide (TPR) repeat protein
LRLLCTAALSWLLLIPAAFPQSGSLESLVEAGHFKQALRELEASKSHDAEALYVLSIVKQSFRQTDDAVRLAEEAVKADPAKAKYHLQLADALSDQVESAGLFKKMSVARRIRSETETAVKLEPKNTDCLIGLMMFYDRAPSIAGGSKEKARQTAEEIGRISPSAGYLAQAQLAAADKQNDKLEGLYMEAVKADPKNFEALAALAAFYASEIQKKYELAETYARRAIAVDRTRTVPYVVSAEVAAMQRGWEHLEQVLAAAEKANRDDLNPVYQAGRVLLQSNQEFSRAEGYFRKYLSQPPEGNAPDLSAAHWRLGLALEKQGRKTDAINEMQEALRLNPNFEQAMKDLKRLKG